MWSQLASLASQVSETVAPVANEFREALREEPEEPTENDLQQAGWLQNVVGGVKETLAEPVTNEQLEEPTEREELKVSTQAPVRVPPATSIWGVVSSVRGAITEFREALQEDSDEEGKGKSERVEEEAGGEDETFDELNITESVEEEQVTFTDHLQSVKADERRKDDSLKEEIKAEEEKHDPSWSTVALDDGEVTIVDADQEGRQSEDHEKQSSDTSGTSSSYADLTNEAAVVSGISLVASLGRQHEQHSSLLHENSPLVPLVDDSGSHEPNGNGAAPTVNPTLDEERVTINELISSPIVAYDPHPGTTLSETADQSIPEVEQSIEPVKEVEQEESITQPVPEPTLEIDSSESAPVLPSITVSGIDEGAEEDLTQKSEVTASIAPSAQMVSPKQTSMTSSQRSRQRGGRRGRNQKAKDHAQSEKQTSVSPRQDYVKSPLADVAYSSVVGSRGSVESQKSGLKSPQVDPSNQTVVKLTPDVPSLHSEMKSLQLDEPTSESMVIPSAAKAS